MKSSACTYSCNISSTGSQNWAEVPQSASTVWHCGAHLWCDGLLFLTEQALTHHLSLCVCLCRSTAQRTVEAARCCQSVKLSNGSSLGSASWRDRPKTSSMLCSTEKVSHTHTFVISHFISHCYIPSNHDYLAMMKNLSYFLNFFVCFLMCPIRSDSKWSAKTHHC